LDRVIADGTSAALFWALSPHSEKGGFKKHTLNNSHFGVSRTVNWPGFDDGTDFDERGLLETIRAAAYKIDRLAESAPEVPAPPTLLPLPETLPWQPKGELALFNWRGSAGASGYRLERAERAGGPFTMVGDRLPDGHVFYQPLATDTSAKLNREYFYRLRAMNGSGVSEPSAVMGPIVFRENLFTDDLRDFTRMYDHSPGVELRSNVPQPYYENLHRVHRAAGASGPQNLTYRCPAGSVVSFRVTAYGDSGVDFLVSSDGKAFQAVGHLDREVTPGYVSLWDEGNYVQTRTIYGPASALPADTRFVRIAFTSAVIGRVEIGTLP